MSMGTRRLLNQRWFKPLTNNYGFLFQSMRHGSDAIAQDLKMTSLSLEESDKELYDLINSEKSRQQNCLNLSPLENYASRAAMDTIQTVLQNKYSEGYPHARYYGGNENVDMAEELCQARALKLFGLSDKEWHVNVQSLSGAPACLEALTAMVSPNSRVLTLNECNGGDSSLGGSKSSALHDFFNVMFYHTNKNDNLINYKELSNICSYVEPDIVITGSGNTSGYPRKWDWNELNNIIKNSKNSNNEKTIHLCDISDVAGLIAVNEYPSPFEYCDIVICATNTSLRGPKGAAIIFCKKEYAQQVDMAVFPGHQGGPHNHAISALATSLLQASSNDFADYQKSALQNATQLAKELENKGYKLLTNGTDTTTVIVDKKGSNCDFNVKNCDENNIHVLYNESSDTVRMSSLAMTTRGLTSNDFTTVADFVDQAAKGNSGNLGQQVSEFVKTFALPGVE